MFHRSYGQYMERLTIIKVSLNIDIKTWYNIKIILQVPYKIKKKYG